MNLLNHAIAHKLNMNLKFCLLGQSLFLKSKVMAAASSFQLTDCEMKHQEVTADR